MREAPGVPLLRRERDLLETVQQLAAATRDPQWLRMLYLLTYADMKAVGPGVLTSWQIGRAHV